MRIFCLHMYVPDGFLCRNSITELSSDGQVRSMRTDSTSKPVRAVRHLNTRCHDYRETCQTQAYIFRQIYADVSTNYNGQEFINNLSSDKIF